jgi:hypothetical protein
MKKYVIIVAIALAAALPAAAQDQNRFALVFGNAAYDGDAALAHSVNDATDMAAALTGIGWKVTRVLDSDRKAMNKAIASFRDAMSGTRDPIALLYYAGHGVQIGGQNYLIPVHETFESPDDIKNDAISLQSILDTFDDARVSTEVVILDACRDNPFAKKMSRSLGGTRGLSVVAKSAEVEGSAVLFATAPGQTAADGNGRNGVFTQALLKYINSDMKLQDLVTKVTGEVKSLTGGKQVPYNSISLSDDFYMEPASMRAAKSAAAPIAAPVAVAPAVAPPVPQAAAPAIPAAAVAPQAAAPQAAQPVSHVPTTFQVEVHGQVAGMKVLIDGQDAGTTPLVTTLERGKAYIVEVSHPDYLPFKQIVEPQGTASTVVVTPDTDHTTDFKIKDLTARKGALSDQLASARKKGAWVPWVNIASWGVAIVGGALAGYAYLEGNSVLADYNSAASSADFYNARNHMSTLDTFFSIGIGAGGGGLALALTTSFMYPKVSGIEASMKDLDAQIQKLNSSQSSGTAKE